MKLVLLLALVGCAATPEPAPVVTVRLDVPAELRACPAMPAAVPVPPKPRTFDAVVEWGQRTERKRQETGRALEVCRAVLVKVLGIVDGGAK